MALFGYGVSPWAITAAAAVFTQYSEELRIETAARDPYYKQRRKGKLLVLVLLLSSRPNMNR